MTEQQKLLLIIESLRRQIERKEIELATRKTHPMIKSKALRRSYASELWQWRSVRKEGAEVWRGFCLGMESGFWAQQKAIAEDMR